MTRIKTTESASPYSLRIESTATGVIESEGGTVPPFQGQRPLTPLASKDFCHEVEIPAATATFHGDAFRAGMLLEQR